MHDRDLLSTGRFAAPTVAAPQLHYNETILSNLIAMISHNPTHAQHPLLCTLSASRSLHSSERPLTFHRPPETFHASYPSYISTIRYTALSLTCHLSFSAHFILSGLCDAYADKLPSSPISSTRYRTSLPGCEFHFLIAKPNYSTRVY